MIRVNVTHFSTAQLVQAHDLLAQLMEALVRERGAIGTLDPGAILEITAKKTVLTDQISMLARENSALDDAASSPDVELRRQLNELATSVHIAAQANAALLRDAQDSILALLGVSEDGATYDRRARSIVRSVPMIGSSV